MPNPLTQRSSTSAIVQPTGDIGDVLPEEIVDFWVSTDQEEIESEG
ncbi:hypothetical protein [Photobacterium lipolyticum]|nr:hypothetical protein [Photobacterium lipolyticum]